MNHYKKYFLMPFILFSIFSVFYSIANIDSQTFSAWLSPLLVCVPFMLFIIIHMSKTIARTSDKLWPIIIFSIIGLLFSLYFIESQKLSFILCAIGLLGNLLYIFWYSVNDRPENKLLEVGSFLPNFTLKTVDGHILTSNYIKTSPALILFYRGNWCPLCMKQIDEIANISERLEKAGIAIYLLGAQSLADTNKIALKYKDKPMQFLHDPEYRALIELNLLHIGGKPKGMAWVDNDTAYPTVLFTAKDGEILWSDQSPNYRIRPEPSIFLELTNSYKHNKNEMLQAIAHP